MQRRAQVIIVEDNPYDAEITAQALENRNPLIDIEVLEDGEQALQYISNIRNDRKAFPRLILLDLKLPKVNGFEVLKRLRSDEQTRIIPVVIFTSSTEDRDRHRSKELGANAYIVKPIAFSAFMDVIEQVYRDWIEVNHLPEG
jgi:CheY-like chemotaxis protein